MCPLAPSPVIQVDMLRALLNLLGVAKGGSKLAASAMSLRTRALSSKVPGSCVLLAHSLYACSMALLC